LKDFLNIFFNIIGSESYLKEDMKV